MNIPEGDFKAFQILKIPDKGVTSTHIIFIKWTVNLSVGFVFPHISIITKEGILTTSFSRGNNPSVLYKLRIFLNQLTPNPLAKLEKPFTWEWIATKWPPLFNVIVALGGTNSTGKHYFDLLKTNLNS